MGQGAARASRARSRRRDEAPRLQATGAKTTHATAAAAECPIGAGGNSTVAVQTRIDLWWLGKGTADRFYTATVVEVEITPDGAKVHLDYDDGKVRPGFPATLLAATVDEVDEPTADLTYLYGNG